MDAKQQKSYRHEYLKHAPDFLTVNTKGGKLIGNDRHATWRQPSTFPKLLQNSFVNNHPFHHSPCSPTHGRFRRKMLWGTMARTQSLACRKSRSSEIRSSMARTVRCAQVHADVQLYPNRPQHQSSSSFWLSLRISWS